MESQQVSSSTTKLSQSEYDALSFLASEGGCVLTSSIPDKNERGVFGIVPGHTVFKKLEKKGLVFYTEEEPISDPGGPLDGFVFTNEIYITDAGRCALSPERP
jgi:hypothetical protein